MRRAALPLLALAAVCAAGAIPALAADQTVHVSGLRFTPPTVAVKPGETVTIVNDTAAAHSLRFTDEPANRRTRETGWTETRTFTAAEARDQPYEYFCPIHVYYDMAGLIYVNADGVVPTRTPSPTASPTPGPAPSATPSPGATPSPTASPSPAPAAKLRSLKLRRAGRRGVVVAIDLSRAAKVRGTLRRGSKRIRLRFGTVAAGPHRLRIKRHLKPGRYRLRLTAGGTTRTLRFRVR